jgi:hypothetical protein
MLSQKIPSKINIWDNSGTYQGKNYITVDFSKTKSDAENNWIVIGNDAEGKRVKIPAKRNRITLYAGKMSEYWRNEWLKNNGMTIRNQNRIWKIENAPKIDIVKLTDNDRKAFKSIKGMEFSDNEIEQISALSAFNGQSVKIESVDPDAASIRFHSDAADPKTLEICIKVFRAYAFAELPPMSAQAAQENGSRQRRALSVYGVNAITRDFLRAKTPEITSYLHRFRLAGNLYVNFGLQQLGECIGEQVHRSEMQLFGLEPSLFPENILKINESRSDPKDEPLRGSWSGEVTIEPNETGFVPREVMEEIFALVGDEEGDSCPHYFRGGKLIRTTVAEFFGDYKGGNVFYHSVTLFRHLVGLGYFGNDWSN